MINANELRIGNYVSDYHASDSFMGKVKTLTHNRCYYGNFHSSYKDLKPIPLTEEILLKCGFKIREITVLGATQKHYSDFRNIAIELLSDEYFMLGLHRGYETIEPIRRVKYVHELQNLIYALTNEELQVEL